LANEIQTQLEKLNNQARFVKMIVDKQLVVSNRKKADIVAELRDKDFRPFPKRTKAKKAGEDEDNEDEDEDENENEKAPGELSDFDYLLSMPIWSLTREKVSVLSR
jgi:DNA topoisomerase II